MKQIQIPLKLMLSTLLISLLSLHINAQMQIENADFEEWEVVSGSDQEPVNWNSFLTANCTMSSFFCNQGQKNQVESSSDVRPGSLGEKSARIWSRSVIGIVANGNLTLGRINMGSSTATSSSNFNYTDRDNPEFNQVLTDMPDSLVFWAKFNPNGHNGKARVSATIHDDYNYRDPEDASASPHVVAKAVLNYPSTEGEWVRFTVPFDYSGPATEAEYILVSFSTNENPGGGAGNDVVYIDDVELIYNENTNFILPDLAQSIFTNQDGEVLEVSETANAASTIVGRQWKYSTTSGGPFTESIVGATNSTYTPFFTEAGVYYVVCETEFSSGFIVSNEVQITVEEPIDYIVSISPSVAQLIMTNELGALLTASEGPDAADSREWKYSLTQGQDYVSFESPETDLNYTPYFEAVGVYYIICESDFNGEIKTSNEVQVEVVDLSNSVSPIEEQTLFVGQEGDELIVTENLDVDSREWKYSTESGINYVSFDIAETNNILVPSFESIGEYYVVCESTRNGVSITSNEVKFIVEEFVSHISPEEDQILLEGVSGTALTVTESHVADSREWKYSTNSGSGYVSFDTPETDESYIPLFDQEGVYYVVCESKLDDITTISNEVIITVEQEVAIDEVSGINIPVILINNEMVVDLFDVAVDNAAIKMVGTDGRVIVDRKLIANQKNTIQLSIPTGIYFYVIEADGSLINGKILKK